VENKERDIPRRVKQCISRLVHSLKDPIEHEGLIVTIVGSGFSGDLIAKNGRWRTRDGMFRVKIEKIKQSE